MKFKDWTVVVIRVEPIGFWRYLARILPAFKYTVTSNGRLMVGYEGTMPLTIACETSPTRDGAVTIWERALSDEETKGLKIDWVME